MKIICCAAISAIFFSVILIFAGSLAGTNLPYFGANMFAATYFLFGTISFLGCALFLFETRDEDTSWNFRIPLMLALAAVMLSSFLFPALQSQEILRAVPGSGLAIAAAGSLAFILLAPCSALFFYSFRETDQGTLSGSVLTCLAVSTVSAGMFIAMPFQLNSTLFLYPTESLFGLWYWLYLIVGMPVIGALFLGRTSMFSKNRDNSSARSGDTPPPQATYLS